MNTGIEAKLNDQILRSVTELDNTLMLAYPRSKNTNVLYLLGCDGQRYLADIFKQARSISYIIQHDFVSGRLIVTKVSNARNVGVGNYGLGLYKHTQISDHVLLQAEEVPDERLQRLFRD
jgi:hypothetical protein